MLRLPVAWPKVKKHPPGQCIFFAFSTRNNAAHHPGNHRDRLLPIRNQHAGYPSSGTWQSRLGSQKGGHKEGGLPRQASPCVRIVNCLMPLPERPRERGPAQLREREREQPQEQEPAAADRGDHGDPSDHAALSGSGRHGDLPGAYPART